MKNYLVLLTIAALITTALPRSAQAAPEIYRHRKNPHTLDAVPAGSTGVVTPKIQYSGGALISTPNIYLIWYGNWNQSNGSDTPDGQQIVRDFSNGIGGSPYFLLNTTYSTTAKTITGSVGFGGEAVDAYSKGTKLRDSDILAIVNTALNGNKLPYDADGVYFILTSSDVRELSGFCTQYCGWHTSGKATKGRVRYSFVGNSNRCLSSCAAQSVSPNNNPGVDGMISVIAHELEEAATDPDPRSGWVDANGAENADKCAWTFGQSQGIAANGSLYNMVLGSRQFLIQRNLKQSTSGDTCNINATQQ